MVEVRKRQKKGNKYYFDLVVDSIRINNCFVEWDDTLDDFRLRFPTKNNRKRIYQVIWFEDEEKFKKIYNIIKKEFRGELNDSSRKN